jgi:hypothetical protein
MAYIPNILVNLVQDDPNYGNIETTFENNTLSSGTENVYYQVTSPSGVIIKTIDYMTPDGVLTVAQPSVSMPLVQVPKVTNGNFEEGVYAMLFQVEDTGNPGVYFDVSLSFEVDVKSEGEDNCTKKGLLDYLVDCFCLKMTVTDLTDYSDVTLVSRELTIIPPTIPNEPAPVNIVTPDASVSFPFSYSGVTYTANLYSIFEHTAIVTGTEGTNPALFPPAVIRESLKYTQAEKVSCDRNLCKLINCINEFFDKTKAQAADLGGIQYLPKNVLDTWLCLNNLLVMYDYAVTCKNTFLIDKIFDAIQDLVNCDCGCSGESSDGIVKLTPICADSENVLAVEGTSPVVVNTVANTATVSLEQGFLDLVYLGLQSLTVDTSNNSPDYLSILPGASATDRLIRFDDSKFKWTSWVQATDAKMALVFGFEVDNTPQPLRYSSNEVLQQVRIDGTFRLNTPVFNTPLCLFEANPVGGNIFVPTNNNTRSGPQIPCFNAGGEVIGSIQFTGTGTSRNLLFTANDRYVVKSVIMCNGILNID